MILWPLALGGWVAAAIAAALAFAAWRRLAARMDRVARASHELRGPITAARLGVQLGELSPERLRALDLELGRAALALSDLAGIAEESPSEPRFEPVDVGQLLVDSVEAWRPVAAERGVVLTMRWSGAPALVLGDRLRLAQASGNLIANAIEHGGGEIEVRGLLDGPDVRLEVIDGGPGLPVPVAELARRGARARRARGRGLAIASEIVHRHGGRLAAAPSERGARIVLTLPAAAGSAASERRPGS